MNLKSERPKVTKSKPIYDFNGNIIGSVLLEDNVVVEASANGKFIIRWNGKYFSDTELSDPNCFAVAT